MKHILSFCFAIICVSHVWAYDAIIDGIYYNLNSTDLTAKVTNETGDYKAESYSGSVIIPTSVSHNNKIYIVTTIGYDAFNSCDGLTLVTIPNSVTRIESSAFSYCSGLTSVTIPNSVTTIGDYAFQDCRGLTSVTIGNSVKMIGNYAFRSCTGLTSVTIPNSVISIGNLAFEFCVGLTSIVLGNSIVTIGEQAFYRCYNLTSIVLPESLTTIGSKAFSACQSIFSITIPNSVTTIGDNAFFRVNNVVYSGTAVGAPWGAKCVNGYIDGYLVYNDSTKTKLCGCSTSIKGTISIPNSVTAIGDYAFYDCGDLTSIFLSDSLMTIGDYAFYGCWNLFSMTIPDLVISLGDYACYDCFDLRFVVVGNSVTTIGNHAFESSEYLSTIYNCSDLNITKGSTNNGYIAYYADKVYNGIIVDDFVIKRDTILTEYIGYEQSIKIPNSITTIADSSFFYNSTKLTSISIGDSVTMIGKDAFVGCNSLMTPIYNSNLFAYMPPYLLDTYTITEGISHIADYAFSRCKKLKSVTIPTSIKKMGSHTFYDCSDLRTITCHAINPPIVGDSTFYNMSRYTKAYVLASSLEDYQFALGWRDLNLLPIGSAEITIATDTIIIQPSITEVTFTWPQNDQAAEYSIVITKDGIVFCTLTFNAQGQLTGIAFAPNRAGSRMLDAAVMTSNGWQFTVTGLDQASKYGYALDALNANKQSIKHYEGEFATDGYTSLEWVTSDKIQGINKMLLDGNLYILRDGNLYTATGARVK